MVFNQIVENGFQNACEFIFFLWARAPIAVARHSVNSGSERATTPLSTARPRSRPINKTLRPGHQVTMLGAHTVVASSETDVSVHVYYLDHTDLDIE